MKILFIISGTKRVAASRYRVYQYLPYLESRGIQYKVVSTISDFMTTLAIRSPEFNGIMRFIYYILLAAERFLRFWFIFLIAPSFDLLFLQRATFPLGLAKLLKLRKDRVIFDIDDAIFLPDTQDRNIITRFKAFVKEREVRDILKAASCVIVENDYIHNYVSKYCDTVHKIPGPIDTERYYVKDKGISDQKKIVLGWIGSPGTTTYLDLLDDVFQDILDKFEGVEIILIGVGKYKFSSKKISKIPWSYNTEIKELQKFDIGLMPMPNDEWTRGKLGCKMLQYMAIGIPSVVSYTPTNAEIVRDGQNGFLVRTKREWIGKLSLLIENRKLRNEIGASGRRTVEELCSVSKNAPRLLNIIESIK